MKFLLLALGLALGAAFLLSGNPCAWAQQTPALQTTTLLPPVREWHGLQLQITGARWSTPDAERAGRKRYYTPSEGEVPTIVADGGLALTYAATVNGTPLSGEDLSLQVQFNGLFNPDEMPIETWGVGEDLLFSGAVSPAWKSVRAEFEVRDPLSPAGASGRDVSRREFKNIALPALDATGVAVQSAPATPIEFTTARGTKVRLVSLTRQQREAQSPKAELTTRWEITPPADAPDARVEVKPARFNYLGENGKNVGDTTLWHDNVENGVEFREQDLPNAARSMNIAFHIEESARSWKRAEAFQRVSFEIPVTALWQSAPLPARVPLAAPVSARDGDLTATWEITGQEGGTRGRGARGARGLLWLETSLATSGLGEWTLQSAVRSDGKGGTSLFGLGSQIWARRAFLHADNSPATPTETSALMYGGTLDYATDDVTLTVQRARNLLTRHVLRDVPLPKRNDTREFGPNEFFDGSWNLHRLTWVDDARLKGKMELDNGAALMLTFECPPDTLLPDGNEKFLVGEQIYYDDKGIIENRSATFLDGDPFEKGREKDRVTMVISPPPVGATRWSGHFRVLQPGWFGPTKTLLLPDVPLRVEAKPSPVQP